MNKVIFWLALLFASLTLRAQESVHPVPKLSAFTQQFLLKFDAQKDKSVLVPGYNYKRINGAWYLSSLIKVAADADESKITGSGILIGTKAGQVWTAQFPADRLHQCLQTEGISYIGLDMPVIPYLDSARKTTRADSAQRGIYLPETVTGRNVIVGVIDAGFDFNHPAFYDTTNNRYRIKKVWAQKISGTPPAGFAYGAEITDSNAIRFRGTDTTLISHGTHVAGIAAGSGYGSNVNNARFRGMAFESDMVMVGIMPQPGEWVTAGESDIIDGMNYIFTYAAGIGKPAVVNLSWGSTLGPHDGNSLFSQACDALTGAGKIFVCAAGNNGEDTVHLQKSFAAADSLVSTFVTFSPYLDSAHLATWVDVWGDTGKSFCLNISLYDTTSAVANTGFICLSDTTQSFNLVGSNGDTCFVTVTMTDTEYNGKPHVFLSFYSRVHDNICLTTKAFSGTVNMWEGYVLPPEGYYGYFKKLGYSWAVSGDANYTVSDIGCTRSALTVGAYTSKTAFRNISGASLYYPGGVRGHIAPFSSFGPTADNRIKPDITAPGFALASAVNSYDTSYSAGATNYSSVICADTVGPRIYRYAMLAGTSMASPCAAGIAGMMLQLNPAMTPDDVKAVIANTALTDTYTGTLPASGTNTWGHGKINAYRAIRYLAGVLTVESKNMDPVNCLLYPNPGNGSFSIDFISETIEKLSVEIFDATGKMVEKFGWDVTIGANTRAFTLRHSNHGLFYTRVTSSAGYSVIRTIVE